MSDDKLRTDDVLVHRVISLLARHMNKDAGLWSGATTLEQLGVDSFDFIEFVFLLEDEFGIAIPYNHNDSTTRFATIGDVADAVATVVSMKSPMPSAAMIDAPAFA